MRSSKQPMRLSPVSPGVQATKTSFERSRSFLIRMEILPPEAGTPGDRGVQVQVGADGV